MVSAAQNSLINASLAPAALANAVSSSVADKTLQAAKLQGSQLVALIDGAGTGSDGSKLPAGDPLVARATGVGGLLDVVG